MTPLLRTTAILVLSVLLSACQSAYYGAWEKFGVHKRDILVDRVEDARESQEDGQKQFQSALEQFKSVVAFEGGALEERYQKLNAEYQASTEAAEEIRKRIEAVDDVARALFSEWREELDEYSNQRLKAESERHLRATEQRYSELYSAMQNAERAIEPVLTTLNDHVLYLKHNLNARAIAALKGEVQSIDADIQDLIERMQRSIKEADRFLTQLREDA